MGDNRGASKSKRGCSRFGLYSPLIAELLPFVLLGLLLFNPGLLARVFSGVSLGPLT